MHIAEVVEAVATAMYIRNPTIAIYGMISDKKYTCAKLDISHLRIFNYIAYVHNLDERRTKLDLKEEKCIFVSYSLQ